jgi:DNA-binding GntR family transcriptional regulator
MRQAPELTREIASYVRDLIMSGQLRSGDPLVIDRLARDLDTSITPVREALQALRVEGFARFEPRRGFRVAPLTRDDFRDLFLVHTTIAGELAMRAATRLTEADLERIIALQEDTRRAIERAATEEVEGLNFEFHRTINHAAAAPKLAWLLGTVVRYLPRRFYASIPGWLDASFRDHDAIIEALKQREPDAARIAMSDHVTHARDLLAAHLEQQGFWSEELDGGKGAGPSAG